MTKLIVAGYNTRMGISNDFLIAHGQQTQTPAMVYDNDLQQSWRFKQAVPGSLVANRVTHHPITKLPVEANLLNIEPMDFLSERLSEFDALGIPHNQIVIHTTNEPQYTPTLIDWHVRHANDVLDHPGVRSVMLNLGVGILPIDFNQLSLMRPLLKLMIEHPDQLIFGHHSYGALVFTSGINGTAYPGYSITHNRIPPVAEYAIEPETWPTVVNNICYHSRRWQTLCEYCHKEFKALPAIWETEIAPSDDIDDVEIWQQSFPKPNGVDRINGMWTCEPAWQQLFPGWTMDEVICKQSVGQIELVCEADFIANDGTRYPSPVIAASFFNVGGTGGWTQFDYLRCGKWWTFYPQYVAGRRAEAGTQAPTGLAWNKGVANLINFQPDENKIVFLRDIPSEEGSRMARIQPGNSLEYWGDAPQNGWWKVRVAGLEGYASAQYLDPRKRDVTATNEVPVVKPTESETPPPMEAPPAQPPVQETSEEVKDYQFSIIVRARQAEAAEIAAATLALIQAGSRLGRALEPIDIRIEDLSALKEAQPS